MSSRLTWIPWSHARESLTRDVRTLALCLIFVGPLTIAYTMGAGGRAAQINEGLRFFLVGALPFFAAALFFREESTAENATAENALVRFGADRRRARAQKLALRLLLLLSVAWLGACLVLFNLRGVRDPLFFHDLLSTSAVSVASALSIGATVYAVRAFGGALGMCLFVVLLWVFGQIEPIMSAALPTGHIRSLLGVGEALPLPPWASFFLLYAFAALFGWLGLLRTKR